MKNQIYATNDEFWCLVQLAKLELSHLGKDVTDEKEIVEKFYHFAAISNNSFTIEENEY